MRLSLRPSLLTDPKLAKVVDVMWTEYATQAGTLAMILQHNGDAAESEPIVRETLAVIHLLRSDHEADGQGTVLESASRGAARRHRLHFTQTKTPKILRMLCNALEARGLLAEAETACYDALAASGEVLQAEAKGIKEQNPDFAKDFGECLRQLESLLRGRGRLQDAEPRLRSALGSAFPTSLAEGGTAPHLRILCPTSPFYVLCLFMSCVF